MTFSHWDAFLRSLGDYKGAVELEKRLNVDPYKHAENENSIFHKQLYVVHHCPNLSLFLRPPQLLVMMNY